MTEETRAPASAEDTSGAEPVSAVVELAPQPSVGERLRTAREARRMNATEVAQMLKLSVRQIDALERDDWASLPGTTISRGFIRNYARLLGLDADELMRQLDEIDRPAAPDLGLLAATNSPLPRSGGVERRDWIVMLAGLLVVGLAVLAYWLLPPDYWQSKLTEWAMGANTTPPPVAAGSEPAPAPLSDQPAPAGAASASDPGATANAVPPVAPPAPSVASLPLVQDAGLKLIFARPSWVEIRDRSGQVVFSQLNAAGSERDIEGQPPFALVIGNASGVTVQYRGKNVELTQRSKDDVARLNLE